METASTTRSAPELNFRAATPTDVPDLVGLIESAYRGDASRVGWTTEADLLDGQRTDADGVAAVVNDAESRLMAAERDGELVACCQLQRRRTGAGETVAYFGMFAVRPALQAAGLGRAILAEAERFAAESWGAREMHMTVISVREELIAWYERRGYRRTGEMTPFPYDDDRGGVPRQPGLEFELLVKPLG
ncbi:GNAT family N-acetyltransferase [Streptomyces sp. NPDC018031]|uniref:GNAT family N-acetyltransferase n=1 Tax=Streptomyces sp. NPDC018031 TaxID=3365033 RepID=UPI00378F257D